MDALWETLRAAPEEWYVFDMQSPPPRAPLSGEAFIAFLDEVTQYAHARHEHDYCGFIYVDDFDTPGFVKIFNPRAMGSSCGGGARIYPRWTISKLAPDPLPTPKTAHPSRGLLARFLHLD